MAKRFVVMGKCVPRSVGLVEKRTALSYAQFYRDKGCKPRIYQVDEVKLKERFFKRYHNTPGYFKKIKRKK